MPAEAGRFCRDLLVTRQFSATDSTAACAMRARVTAEQSGYPGIRAGQSRKSPLSPDGRRSLATRKGTCPAFTLGSSDRRCRDAVPASGDGHRQSCCKRSDGSVELPVAGPRARNDEWTARDDGGPSVRTRVEPEGHRRAPPPVLKAPRRRMWGFSLRFRRPGNHRWARDSARRRSPDGGRLRRCGLPAASAPRSPRFPRRTRPPKR
jgi:hypothetical protein